MEEESIFKPIVEWQRDEKNSIVPDNADNAENAAMPYDNNPSIKSALYDNNPPIYHSSFQRY